MDKLTKLVDSEKLILELNKVYNKAIKYLNENIHKLDTAAVLSILNSMWTHVRIMFGLDQIFWFVQASLVLQCTFLMWEYGGNVCQYVLDLCTQKGRYKRRYLMELDNAKSYDEWLKIAWNLDMLSGAAEWREAPKSFFYDEVVLRKRKQAMDKLTSKKDIFGLMFNLRSGISRGQFGIQHEGLYSRALSGTKYAINSYVKSVCSAFECICESVDTEEIPGDVKLAFFNESRHSFGRTALLLSGGAYLGYYHMGLAKCLFYQGLLPKVVNGASAGSLMAAILGTKTDQELEKLFDPYLAKESGFRSDHFCFGYQKKAASIPKSFILDIINKYAPTVIHDYCVAGYCLFTAPYLLTLDIDHLKEVAVNNYGTYTFQEAYDRTGRICNITVAPVNNYDPPRLLNYLTAPHVCVWSAAVASCAIPFMFDSVPLIIKDSNGAFRAERIWQDNPSQTSGLRRTLSKIFQIDDNTESNTKQTQHVETEEVCLYNDGSIESDLPMRQLSELFNVNHFIVSQVNAHSWLFSATSVYASVWSGPLFGFCAGYVRFIKAQVRGWISNLVDLMVYRLKAPLWSSRRGFVQLLTQDYEGRDEDVTIMPWKNHISLVTAFINVIKNPTDEEYLEVIQAAEKATWPYLARIKAHCEVESVLNRCSHEVKTRLLSHGAVNRLSSDASVIPDRRKLLLSGTRDSFVSSRSSDQLQELASGPPPGFRHVESSVGKGSFNTNDSFKLGSSGHEQLNMLVDQDDDFQVQRSMRSRSYSNISTDSVTDENVVFYEDEPVEGFNSVSESGSGFKRVPSMSSFYYKGQ